MTCISAIIVRLLDMFGKIQLKKDACLARVIVKRASNAMVNIVYPVNKGNFLIDNTGVCLIVWI